MRIRYKQKFHSVGQGLFYSSSFYNDNIEVNVIFDCGSNNIELVNQEIDKLENYKIDVLIISHLHFDHISGLDYLLNNKKAEIKTIVLPYLYPEERILIQTLNYNKPEWYNEFLSNPYSYLNEKNNVENIIIINGSDDDNDYSDKFSEEKSPLSDNLINENRNIRIELEDVDDEIKKTIGKNENLKFSKKLSLMKDKGYLLISNMYLSFFNYKIKNDQKVNNFYNEINNLGINNTTTAITVLKDSQKRNELVNSYKIISKNLNLTSLSAYQGLIIPYYNSKHEYSFSIRNYNPIQYNFLNNLFYCDCDGFINGRIRGHFHSRLKYKFYCNFHGHFDCFCDNPNHCNIQIGTLLLGDIKLDYKTNKRKDMFKHFKKLLPFVQLVQLSHHGAKNGWNDYLIEKIPKNSLYIASHRTNNSNYHHPHKEVVMKLAENYRKFVSVTERNEYYNDIDFIIN